MSEKILFINSCIRGERSSRTYELSSFFAKRYLGCRKDAQLEEIHIGELGLAPFCGEMIDLRDKAVLGIGDKKIIAQAEKFAKADTIIVAAPYWDMSFPSILRVYTEHICVCGVTCVYEPDGTPKGLCRAKKAVYITTAGGFINDKNYGFDYIKDIFEFMGICDTHFLSAEGLDIDGNDPMQILENAKRNAAMLAEKI